MRHLIAAVRLRYRGGMRPAPRHNLWRLCLAFVLAATLAASGGLRPATERPATAAEAEALALFLAAGGSLSDLCHDAGGGHEAAHRGECPACILPAALLPPAGPSLALRLAARPVGLAPAARIALRVAADPGLRPPPTGPPVPSFS
jgi:hypothetical protein